MPCRFSVVQAEGPWSWSERIEQSERTFAEGATVWQEGFVLVQLEKAVAATVEKQAAAVVGFEVGSP